MKAIFINIIGDPTIIANIHGRKLFMPISHNLPIYVARFKYYDTALTRVSDLLRKDKKNLTYIDVGANVGDSILAINPEKGDKIIGVEPNPKFEKYLRKNLKGYSNIIIEKVICSSSSKNENIKILEKNGTASIVSDEGSDLLVKETLDDIVKRNNVGKVDLLKVDTDGHDFEVLKGARKTIKKDTPTVFFECDSFGSQDYEKNVFELLDFLLGCGYKSAILYDNFGYLFGLFNLKDKEILKNFLFYQTHSNFYYFDILILPNQYVSRFVKEERNVNFRQIKKL